VSLVDICIRRGDPNKPIPNPCAATRVYYLNGGGMRIDFYTRVVLTVIAACLVWLSFGGPALLPIAHAQPAGTNQVVIAGWTDSGGIVHRLSDPSKANVPGLPVAVVWGH
jgi:hypothetical protein